MNVLSHIPKIWVKEMTSDNAGWKVALERRQRGNQPAVVAIGFLNRAFSAETRATTAS